MIHHLCSIQDMCCIRVNKELNCALPGLLVLLCMAAWAIATNTKLIAKRSLVLLSVSALWATG